MAEQITEHGDHDIPFVNDAGLIPNAAEIAERERAEQQRRQESDHQLVLDLQKRQAEAQEVQAKSNTVIAGLTGAVVIVSFISGFVSYLQFIATNKAAEAAKSAADTARDAFIQSKADSIAQDKRSREALEASANQSRAALDASVAASRTDQRAWVAPSSAASDPLMPEVGKTLHVKVTLKNTGKTPAVNASQQSAFQGILPGEHLNFSYSTNPSQRVGLIPPNADFYATFTAAGSPLTKFGVDALNSGNPGIYVHGVLRYADVFKGKHWLTYCYVLIVPFDGHWKPCEQHNDTGDGENPSDWPSAQPTK